MQINPQKSGCGVSGAKKWSTTVQNGVTVLKVFDVSYRISRFCNILRELNFYFDHTNQIVRDSSCVLYNYVVSVQQIGYSTVHDDQRKRVIPSLMFHVRSTLSYLPPPSMFMVKIRPCA